MEYTSEVLQKLDMVSLVLSNLNVPPLLVNHDFFIDNALHFKHYVKLVLSKPNSPNIQFIFTNDMLRIDIDRVQEAFEWSNKQIEKGSDELTKFMEVLFTSTIKIEYCCSTYTKIHFINSQGHILHTLKYVTGLYLKIRCREQKYLPIYPPLLEE